MESLCSRCGKPGGMHYCNCESSPLPYCAKCLQEHKDSHRPSSKSASLSCSECDSPAEFLCISASVYICSSHTEEHKVTCPACDLYPIDQAELFMSIPHGSTVLKRGKIIARAKELLEVRLEQVETNLKKKFEIEFLSVITELEATKTKFLSVIETNVRKLREEYTAVILRLETKIKEEQLVPITKLERLVLQFNESNLSSAIMKEQWIDIWADHQQLSDISETLFRLERCESLLDLLPSECPWAHQFYLFPGPRTTIYDLKEQQSYESPLSINFEIGMVWLALPDGRFFICGNDTKAQCSMIDRDFLECREVGKMAVGRSSPGAAQFLSRIYIFGGWIQGKEQNSAEVFDLKSNTSTKIYSKMHQSRALFWPCVWNSQIFIAGGLPTGGIEIFRPITEEFVSIAKILNSANSCLALSFSSDEIVFLSLDISSFFPDSGILEYLTDERVQYNSVGCPLLWNGCFYFEAIDGVQRSFKSIQIETHQISIIKSLP